MSHLATLHDLITADDVIKLKEFCSSKSNAPELCLQEHNAAGCSLHHACSSGSVEIVEYLINTVHIPIDIPQQHPAGPAHCRGSTALMQACAHNHHKVVLYLLGKRCDVNVQDASGKTALHYACTTNSQNTVQMLMDSGSQVNITDNTGQSALHVSMSRGSEMLAMLLLQHGAAVNLRDHRGRTCLHYAVETGCKNVVDRLLQLSCRLDAADEDGNTALQLVNDGDIYDVLVHHQQCQEQRNVEIKLKNNPKDLVKQRILHSHGHHLVSRTFSPGPPTPEAELLGARSKHLRHLQTGGAGQLKYTDGQK